MGATGNLGETGHVTVVRIFQPSKTAMQSGRGKTHHWVLEFEPGTPKFTDPLMGWTGSADTRRQVRMKFARMEDAVAFAEKRGFRYELQQPHSRTLRPKSYAENFRS
jgi:hypothetical protein